MPERLFTAEKAFALVDALTAEGVDYLVIGAYAAILLGAPAITQDIDLYLPKARARENGERMIRVLEKLGFQPDLIVIMSILTGSEFVLLRKGPFDLDLLHSPDGIDNYDAAKARSVLVQGRFPVVSLDDLIASKRAAGRAKDLATLPMLESLRFQNEKHDIEQP